MVLRLLLLVNCLMGDHGMGLPEAALPRVGGDVPDHAAWLTVPGALCMLIPSSAVCHLAHGTPAAVSKGVPR